MVKSIKPPFLRDRFTIPWGHRSLLRPRSRPGLLPRAPQRSAQRGGATEQRHAQQSVLDAGRDRWMEVQVGPLFSGDFWWDLDGRRSSNDPFFG